MNTLRAINVLLSVLSITLLPAAAEAITAADAKNHIEERPRCAGRWPTNERRRAVAGGDVYQSGFDLSQSGVHDPDLGRGPEESRGVAARLHTYLCVWRDPELPGCAGDLGEERRTVDSLMHEVRHRFKACRDALRRASIFTVIALRPDGPAGRFP